MLSLDLAGNAGNLAGWGSGRNVHRATGTYTNNTIQGNVWFVSVYQT